MEELIPEVLEETPLSQEPAVEMDALGTLQRAYEALQKDYEALQKDCEERSRRSAEEAEFAELYPEVSLTSLPDSVRNHESLPLAAAYALHERRKLRTAALAESQNAQNAQKSAGAVRHDGASDGTFALSEIKRMTPKEIRAHYTSVLRSLKKQKS